MLQLVVSGVNYKGNLAIGTGLDLLFNLRDDLQHLSCLTKQSLSKNSKLSCNVVIMGRVTYYSIPNDNRPLKDRINLVLTRDSSLLKDYCLPSNYKKIKPGKLYFVSYDSFWKMYNKCTPNVFVLGGREIYNYFMERCQKLYITHITLHNKLQQTDLVTITPPSSYFKLIGWSKKYSFTNEKDYYRILIYTKSHKQSEESVYLDLMSKVMSTGTTKCDRTNVGTVSNFGNSFELDVSSGTLPLLTTKTVSFKNIVEELLWFCRGETDNKILQKKGVHIWDHNTSREFLDSQGLHDYPEGILGPGYGFQWRHFGAEYKFDSKEVSGGVDQLEEIIKLLKTDPFSRRIVLSAWNPPDFPKTALVPCHLLLQFYVEVINGKKHLSLLFFMRSNDLFLALNYNVVSYTVLLHIISLKVDMIPKKIVYMSGDAHIYSNHIAQTEELLTRQPRSFPKLIINPDVKDKSWENIQYSDFEVVGYFPHQPIKAKIN